MNRNKQSEHQKSKFKEKSTVGNPIIINNLHKKTQ